jgi:hypothetical protein
MEKFLMHVYGGIPHRKEDNEIIEKVQMRAT